MLLYTLPWYRTFEPDERRILWALRHGAAYVGAAAFVAQSFWNSNTETPLEIEQVVEAPTEAPELPRITEL